MVKYSVNRVNGFLRSEMRFYEALDVLAGTLAAGVAKRLAALLRALERPSVSGRTIVFEQAAKGGLMMRRHLRGMRRY